MDSAPSRFTLLMSVLGIAVGTGNIWRFPRIVAANGGDERAGAFLVAWLMCLLTWSIPLIIAEYVMSRASRAGGLADLCERQGNVRPPWGPLWPSWRPESCSTMPWSRGGVSIILFMWPQFRFLRALLRRSRLGSTCKTVDGPLFSWPLRLLWGESWCAIN